MTTLIKAAYADLMEEMENADEPKTNGAAPPLSYW